MMKRRKAVLAMAVLFMIGAGGISGSSTRESREGAGETKQAPPDRARWCRVRASGARVARASEIPKSRRAAANVMLILPPVRARWIPEYAVDGTPSTFWASQEKPNAWLELQTGNRLQPLTPVAKLVLRFGPEPPSRFRVMASNDGSYWRQVAEKDKPQAREEIQFQPPVMAARFRLEFERQNPGSVVLKEVEVYGPADEKAPETVKGLSIRKAGPCALALSWDSPGQGDTAWLFRVYRSTEVDPPLTPRYLAATTDKTDFTDYGLEAGKTYYYRVVAESFGGARGRASGLAKAEAPGPAASYRFRFRGVVEGFYNQPWAHQERVKMLAFLGDAGMNYYIYAPKNDPYHRQWWRKPYPREDLANFRELVAAAAAHGITFNYAISPGLDMNFKDPEEMKTLLGKLESLFHLGVRAFTMCFDDIDLPGTGSPDGKTAKLQVKLVNEVHDYLRGLAPDTTLFFVPTVYSRTYSYWKRKDKKKAAYLERLSELHPEIGIMWTGPGDVFSERIDAASAEELKNLWNRPILIWDNYPVNDVALRFNIFTGPYLGRDPDLGKHVDGLFLNPMFLPNASRIALFTAGEYMREGEYKPWESYERALRFVGGREQGYHALKPLADCLTVHPVFSELSVERLPVYQAVQDFWSARGTERGTEAKENLRGLFAAYARNPEELSREVDNFELVQELLPASEKLSLYGRAGLKALELLESREPERNALLRRDILELQTRARAIPWRVADESTGLSYSFLGIRPGRRNVLDDFITRALRQVP